MIQIQVHGLDKVQKLLAELPKQLDIEILKKSEEFMRFVQKSAKLRAPRDTGFLSDQIKVTKKGNIITLDTGEAYYAKFQEFGFTPHIIPFAYMKQHRTLSPNIPGMETTQTGGFTVVSKSKPFIFPALDAGLNRLPTMLKSGINNAINKSKRK
jgi:hypothetical protein